jgi:hypothetical protein
VKGAATSSRLRSSEFTDEAQIERRSASISSAQLTSSNSRATIGGENIRTFIEVRPLEQVDLAGLDMAREIIGKFSIQLHTTTINKIRRGVDFQYQPPQHVQALTPEHATMTSAEESKNAER